MYKAKLFGFAVVCAVALANMNTDAVLAAETNSKTVEQNQTPTGASQKDNKKAMEEKMKEASQKWSALSDKQKQEVYSLLESELQARGKVLDKLADLGVIQKEEANFLKARMTESYNKAKTSGEFPLARPRDSKSRK